MNAKILGTGIYLPERVMTNFDLVSIDVCSMYPALMSENQFPVGRPLRVLEDDLISRFKITPNNALLDGVAVEGSIQVNYYHVKSS